MSKSSTFPWSLAVALLSLMAASSLAAWTYTERRALQRELALPWPQQAAQTENVAELRRELVALQARHDELLRMIERAAETRQANRTEVGAAERGLDEAAARLTLLEEAVERLASKGSASESPTESEGGALLQALQEASAMRGQFEALIQRSQDPTRSAAERAEDIEAVLKDARALLPEVAPDWHRRVADWLATVDDPGIAVRMARVLRPERDPSLSAWFEGQLERSPDEKVREEAAEALWRCRQDPRVLALLRSAAERDPSAKVRREAQRSLRRPADEDGD